MLWFLDRQYMCTCSELRLIAFGRRERPAAIPVHVKSIDDTSNFDDFSDADIRWPGAREASKLRETGPGVSDLPWINYTFKVHCALCSFARSLVCTPYMYE